MNTNIKLSAESIAAVTGLWPTSAPTRGTLKSAQSIAAGWGSRLSIFVEGKQGKFDWELPPPSEELHKKIVSLPTEDEATEWLTAIGEEVDVGLEYMAVITRGRDYLLSLWPNIQIPGVVVDNYPLSQDDLDAIWSVYRVLNDPDVLISDIESWTLTDAQAAGFRAVFPEISAIIDRAIESVVVDFVSNGMEIPWQVADVIRIWKALPLDAPIAVQISEEKPKTEEPRVGKSDIISTARAPSERGILEPR